MAEIYVTGHRNPDTDSIASAIGYAELLRRLNPNDEYRAVRLGELNAQTRWVLERAGATEPDFLPHVLLRVRDVMQADFSLAVADDPIIFGTRGRPMVPENKPLATWYIWPRGEHSAKPDAFYDLVEQVSPGPYVELFARRARFGWDYAGDGSLGTVDIPGLRSPGAQQEAA